MNYLLMVGGTWCGYPEEGQSYEYPQKIFFSLDEAKKAAEEYVKNSADAEQFPGTDSFGYLNSYFMSFKGIIYEMHDDSTPPTIVFTTWSDIEFVHDEKKTKNVIISHTDERIEVPHRP